MPENMCAHWRSSWIIRFIWYLREQRGTRTCCVSDKNACKLLLQGSVMEINEKDGVTERVSAALSFLMTENVLHYISVLENESDRSSGYE